MLTLPPAIKFLFSIRKLTPLGFRVLAVLINEHCVNKANPTAIMKMTQLSTLAGQPPEQALIGLDELIATGLAEQLSESVRLTADTLKAIGKSETGSDEWLAQFDVFWKAYPSKNSKLRAKEAYRKALRAGVKPETMLNGIAPYKIYLADTGIACAYAATWINGRRWDDQHCAPEETQEETTEKALLNLHTLKLGNAEYDELWAKVGAVFATQFHPVYTGVCKWNGHFKDVGLAQINGGRIDLSIDNKTPRFIEQRIHNYYSDRLKAAFRAVGVPADEIHTKGIRL